MQTYGVTDQQEIDTFLKSVREANKRGWWHTYRDVLPDWFAAYLSLEQAALQIRAYEAEFVPGLLQTEDYARALLSAGNPHSRARPPNDGWRCACGDRNCCRGPRRHTCGSSWTRRCCAGRWGVRG